MATRRRHEESRISQLPKHILQHILCFLPQKEAIQTCVLSKSWRHLGPTRPNVVLRDSDWYRDEKKFMSVVEKTLQRYRDQKQLSIQDLHVEMSSLDPHSSSILEKLVKNMNVKTFRLAFTDVGRYPLPTLIFQQAESLKELYLTRVLKIDVKLQYFKHLQTLHLKECIIDDDILVNIISSCPLIEHMVLHYCMGLKTIKLNKAHNLTRFDCSFTYAADDDTLENISLNDHFPHLKTLYLCNMRLSAKSFHNLSSNNYFPCLEELELDSCHVFKEKFVLSSRSIKRLIIRNMSCKGAIDAPNILYFRVSNSCVPPPSISLTTTSRKWKSHIEMFHPDFVGDDRFLKMIDLLKALSQSKIYFKPSSRYFFIDYYGHFVGEPVVLENLDLRAYKYHSLPDYADVLIFFLRVCRPRYIIGMCLGVTAETELGSSGDLTSWRRSNIIIKERVGLCNECCFSQQDLEELSSEVWDHNAKEWHHVQLGTLSYRTRRALSEKQEIRYRLKWRGDKL